MTVPTVMSKSARAKAREEEFLYVLKEVVGLDDNNVLIHALGFHGTSSMADLLAMTNKDIGKLSFIGDDGKDMIIPRAKTNIVRILQAFNFHLVRTHGVKRINWKGASYVSDDKFDNYQVSEYDPNATRSLLGVTTSVVPSYVSSYHQESPANHPTRSLVSDFKKGIKRDKSHYRELKEKGYWDEWRRATSATASSHGCNPILDTGYMPKSQDERDVFAEMQKFMYDVFVSTLRTTMGKHIV